MARFALRLVAALAGALAARPAGAAEPPEEPLELKTWRTPGAVYDIAQTQDGFLWFGTQVGLRRFDGASFFEVDANTAPALGDNHARRLLAARDRALWIATGGGILQRGDADRLIISGRAGTPGLVRYAAGAFTRFSSADGLPNDWVWALADDPAGGIWIGTEGGLARWRDGRFSKVPLTEGAQPGVFALLALADGELWVGTSQGLLHRPRAGGRFERTSIDGPVLALARDGLGRLWMNTQRTVIRYDGERSATFRPVRPPSSLITDRHGRVWVGTEEGLFRIEDGRAGDPFVRIQPGRWILALREDREGSLWAGSRIGDIAHLRAPIVRNFGAAEGLGAEMAFAVLPARDGSVWVSTLGGVARFQSGRFEAYAQGTHFPHHMMRSLAEAPAGSVWIASYVDGLLRFQDGRFQPFGRAQGLPSDQVRSIYVDRAGALWLTFVDIPGLVRFAAGWEPKSSRHPELRSRPTGVPDGAAVTFGAADGLCGGSLTFLTAGPSGRLWLTNDEGLSTLEGGTTGQAPDQAAKRGRCFTARDGLPAGTIIVAHEDADGTLWLGADAGLVRWRGGRFATISRTAGLQASSPSSILDDGRGHFWLTSPVGVFRVRRAELDDLLAGKIKTVQPLVYNAEDGMRSQECTGWFAPGAALDRDGRVWAPTLAGLSVITPPERAPALETDASIVDVLVGGQRAPFSGAGAPVRLPRGGGDVELHFTAPAFVQQSRLRFRYRMHGLEDRWIDAGARRQVRYPRLTAGKYVFRVEALDRLGHRVGREAALAVTVPPHLWETGGFFAFIALLVAGAALGLHRLRVSRIEARHAAIHAERARIARDLHDNLGQAFASIGLHLDGLRLLLKGAEPRVRETLEQARGIVDHCHDETRRSIWNIRGSAGKSPTLGALLESIVAGFPKDAAISIDVSGAPSPVPPLVQHELGHIAREAIANAVRHADAGQIRVEARTDGAGLALRVLDDGGGIPAAALAAANGAAAAGGAGAEGTMLDAAGGIGLLGMRERASRIGGKLEVKNGDRGGTEVCLVVPKSELDRLAKETDA